MTLTGQAHIVQVQVIHIQHPKAKKNLSYITLVIHNRVSGGFDDPKGKASLKSSLSTTHHCGFSSINFNSRAPLSIAHARTFFIMNAMSRIIFLASHLYLKNNSETKRINKNLLLASTPNSLYTILNYQEQRSFTCCSNTHTHSHHDTRL